MAESMTVRLFVAWALTGLAVAGLIGESLPAWGIGLMLFVAGGSIGQLLAHQTSNPMTHKETKP